jgi:hypothetical protein
MCNPRSQLLGSLASLAGELDEPGEIVDSLGAPHSITS